MEKKKKQYQKPMLEKVNLRVNESVLQACKTGSTVPQPNGNRPCTSGGGNRCSTTTGS